MDRHELKHALHDFEREQRFQRGMRQTHDKFQEGMGDAVRGGVRDTALLAAGTAVVGYAAAKNLRFRYWLQAILHFPFAIAVSYVVFMLIGVGLTYATAGENVSDDSAMNMLLIAFGLAVPVGIVWSIVYIRLRTLPKLRRLEGR